MYGTGSAARMTDKHTADNFLSARITIQERFKTRGFWEMAARKVISIFSIFSAVLIAAFPIVIVLIYFQKFVAVKKLCGFIVNYTDNASILGNYKLICYTFRRCTLSSVFNDWVNFNQSTAICSSTSGLISYHQFDGIFYDTDNVVCV